MEQSREGRRPGEQGEGGPSWAQGSLAGRNREVAILRLESSRGRLRELEISFAARFYDAASAFGCSIKSSITSKININAPGDNLEQSWQLGVVLL